MMMLLWLLMAWGNGVLLAQSDLRAGLELLAAKKLTEAQAYFENIIRNDSNHAAAYYALAETYYAQQQVLREEGKYQVRLLNLQPQLDLLKKSYQAASTFTRLYALLSTEQKKNLRKIVAVSDQMLTTTVLQRVEQEAFQLINQAPYRRPQLQLFQSKIYNRSTDLDTLIKLRQLLIQQCKQYMQDYPRSPHVADVRQIAREMLEIYTNKQELRRYGERDGRNYERFCKLIWEFNSTNTYRHILPEFYGAYFGFTQQNYLKHANYAKLVALGKQFNLSPEQLLCELNLHESGYSPEKKSLYDAFIKRFAPTDVALVAVKKMAAFFIKQQDWTSAQHVFREYRPLFTNMSHYFDRIDALLAEPESEIKLENLGNRINSAEREYNPVLSLDGKTLYFSRYSYATGEDIYVSYWDGSQWSEAKRLGSPVNTESHETPIAISPDGNTLFLFGNYYLLPQFEYIGRQNIELGKGDFYFAEKQNNAWEKISVIPNPINSKNFESGFCMSADGNAVIFSSDRPGAVGGYMPNYHPDYLYYHGAGEFNLDLYVSERTQNGWSQPINLGKLINTPFAETNPWLHPDMRTLYFISDGHPGLGGYDIFVSRRLRDDSWTEWSEPVNLGKTINTAYNDVFHMTSDGKTALITSRQLNNTFGESDIYRIRIPQAHWAEPVVVVVGTVLDTEGNPVNDAVVTWHAMDNSSKGSVKVQPNGKFSLPLKKGKKYRYQPSAPNHFATSKIIDLSEGVDNQTVIQETIHEMLPLRKPSSKGFVMQSLEFDFDSDKIRPPSLHDLEQLAAQLQDSNQTVYIEGHTDNKGSDKFNLDLSQRRAENVKRYLLAKGCKAKLVARGFGRSCPVVPNTTEEGRQKNRRVELRIE
ncbi:MAG: OmpA family protein [Cytophagales bacterium]|nr:OmpA family protein [Bernardetiaceae bacterium]MDW8203820.1 OmpA family protein [Cytophagales bacterium]